MINACFCLIFKGSVVFTLSLTTLMTIVRERPQISSHLQDTLLYPTDTCAICHCCCGELVMPSPSCQRMLLLLKLVIPPSPSPWSRCESSSSSKCICLELGNGNGNGRESGIFGDVTAVMAMQQSAN